MNKNSCIFQHEHDGRKVTNIQKLHTIFVILSPVLLQYESGIPGISLSEVLLLLTTSLIILNNRKLKINNCFIFFAFYLVCSTLLTFISLNLQNNVNMEAISRLIRWIFYSIIIIVNFTYVDMDYSIKIYKKIAFYIAAYVTLQFIFFLLFRKILPIKVLPFNLSRDITDLYTNSMQFYFRASGVFVEPGYAVQFLFPSLVFYLYDLKNNNKKYLQIIIISCSILTTVSMQGIAILCAIYFMYLLTLNYRRKSTLIIIVLLVIILIIFLGTDAFVIIVNRLEILRTPMPGGSTALRVYRGFDLFNKIPNMYKIIGIGHGNLKKFIIDNSIISKYDSINMTELALDYVNGASAVLLYNGIVGFVLFALFIVYVYKHVKNEYKMLLILFIFLNFGEGCMFNNTMMFQMVFILSGLNYKKRVKSYD